MKNLYLNVVAILITSISVAQQIPQNQNANWLYENNSGLTFLPNPNNPTVLSNNLYFNEGCATVSDQTGNLLFSTDGVTVWDANENVLINGNNLFGSNSSTQGAVILLRPGHDTYYIATIDGQTGSERGIHYSEVDMSLGVSGTVLSSNRNTPLKDSSGIPFGAISQVSSEKLTSTVHSNGVDYWLVTQIADEIYAYLVTSSGIALDPIVSPALVNVNTPPIQDALLGPGQMKISPNTQRIGVCYYQGNIDIGENGYLALGDFDNTTGLVSFDPELIQIDDEEHTGYYGMEFSPNSEHAYFTTRGESTINSARNSGTSTSYTSIYTVNARKTTTVKTPVLVAQNIVNQTSSTPIQTPDLGLQLAINGRIYSKTHETGTTKLTVINNPNDAENPGYEEITTLGEGGKTMPQWVHNHTIELCDANITLSTPDTNVIQTYQYSDFIRTNVNYTMVTGAGQNITFEAGNFIQFDPNTHIGKAALCLATITPCGEIIGESTTSGRGIATSYPSQLGEESKGMRIFPNPSNNMVNINYPKGINTITITAIDGKAVYSATANNEKNHLVNVSMFSKGIYMVSIETPNGEFLTKKLVVN